MEHQKIIIVRTNIDKKLYEEAKELCGFTHQDIVEMIADIGISGLSNYVHDPHNWVDESGS